LADAYTAPALFEALLAGGHRAAEIGEVMAGPPRRRRGAFRSWSACSSTTRPNFPAACRLLPEAGPRPDPENGGWTAGSAILARACARTGQLDRARSLLARVAGEKLAWSYLPVDLPAIRGQVALAEASREQAEALLVEAHPAEKLTLLDHAGQHQAPSASPPPAPRSPDPPHLPFPPPPPSALHPQQFAPPPHQRRLRPPPLESSSHSASALMSIGTCWNKVAVRRSVS
jgi:hypothetical protein